MVDLHFIPMKNVEIITIGTEVLIGQVIDTNSAWIGEQLQKVGLNIFRKTSIKDEKNLIISTLKKASEENDIIITTGGLGLTQDDITKNAIAEWLQRKLVYHEPSVQNIYDFYKKRNRDVNESVLKMALIIEGSEGLLNPVGASPGMFIPLENHKLLICLPGVPKEMQALFEKYVLPKLSILSDRHTEHFHLHLTGLPEAEASKLLKDFENSLPDFISIAYLPSYKLLRMRLDLHTEKDNHNAKLLFQKKCKEMSDILQDYIISYEQESLEEVILRLLIEKNKTIAIAESCTGGNLVGSLVKLSGASKVLKGGVVAYSNEIKQKMLGVSAETLEQYGAVSEPTALQMAKGILNTMQADIAISTTGIAGPEGGTPQKPVGTVCVALVTQDFEFVKTYRLGDSPREIFMERVIAIAWENLRRFLIGKSLK
jgi:nicotinamide-nucleotide amidase